MDFFELFKYLALLGSSPIWFPFAKELYRALQQAMREDGGIYGPIPSPRERERIRAELDAEVSPQVHEPLAWMYEGRGGRAGASNEPTGAGPQAGTRRRGFAQ